MLARVNSHGLQNKHGVAGNIQTMPYVKRCAWGTCNIDSRYPERCTGIKFIPFVKPGKYNYHLDQCLKLTVSLIFSPFSELFMKLKHKVDLHRI